MDDTKRATAFYGLLSFLEAELVPVLSLVMFGSAVGFYAAITLALDRVTLAFSTYAPSADIERP